MKNYSPANKSEQRTISKTPTNQDSFVKMIQAFESQLKLALPRHLSPSKMTRIILTEVRKEPKLAECDRTSFLGALITCAQMGLEPGAALGHAYILPYLNKKKGKYEAQLIIGYQGKIDLIERDQRITINASCVYEKDEFSFEEGCNPYIKHKPYLGEDPGKIIASYAVARYADGRKKMRVLRMHEILNAKKYSSNQYGPWATAFSEMAMKTAIHRLAKQLPKNPEMTRAIELADKESIDESQNLGDVYKDFREDQGLEEIEGLYEESDIPALPTQEDLSDKSA